MNALSDQSISFFIRTLVFLASYDAKKQISAVVSSLIGQFICSAITILESTAWVNQLI